jgi:hypothetical protein
MMKKLLYMALFCMLGIVACSKKNKESPLMEKPQPGPTSMFALAGTYLYIVEDRSLHIYSTLNPGSPIYMNTINLISKMDIEAVFSDGKYLFLNASSGLLIYSLANPSIPGYIATTTQISSCDRMVTKDSIIFVSVSTGTICNNGNFVSIFNLLDGKHMQALKFYGFSNPKGMTISGNYLYLCDGAAGLKVLDITDYMQVNVINSLPSLPCTDVTLAGHTLIITGIDGLYQYDCADPLDLKFISKINTR